MKSSGFSLLEIHSQYFEVVTEFERSENMELFNVALEGYRSVLESYILLGVRIKSTDMPNALGDWRSIALVLSNLRKIIERSTRRKRSPSLIYVTNLLETTLRGCIFSGEEYLFSKLLGLYRTMFQFSRQSGNTVGLHRAHFVPIQLLEFNLFNFGETEDVNLDTINNRCQLAELIFDHLEGLLHDTVEDNDEQAFGIILDKLNPSELIDIIRPHLPFDLYEVEAELKRNDISETDKVDLRDKQDCHHKLKSFFDRSSLRFSELTHHVMMYQIDRLENDAEDIAKILPIIRRIWNNLPDLNATVSWLDRHNSGQTDSADRLWEFWPDSRQVQSKDPMRASLILFVLRMLSIQSQTDETITLPSSRAIHSYKEQLLELSREINKNGNWKSLIGTIDQGSIAWFEEKLTESVTAYNSVIAESVSSAPLSQSRIDEFKNSVRKSFDQSLTLSHLMSVPISSEGGKPFQQTESETLKVDARRWPKEAFIEQDRISYRNNGADVGRALAHELEWYIWKVISESIQEKSRELFVGDEDLLAKAIETHDETDRNKFALVIPGKHKLRFDLWSRKGFVSYGNLGKSTDRGFYGEYKGIPTYNIFNRNIDKVLLFDPADVRFKDSPQVELEIRDFTDKERAAISKSTGEDESTLKQEVWVDISVKFALEFRDTVTGTLFG